MEKAPPSYFDCKSTTNPMAATPLPGILSEKTTTIDASLPVAAPTGLIFAKPPEVSDIPLPQEQRERRRDRRRKVDTRLSGPNDVTVAIRSYT